MKYTKVLIFLLIGMFSPIFVTSKANLETLLMSQVIFRHGARTIDQTYPTDPYKSESFWKPGYSQLTNLGKYQGYNLGLLLRERYDGFVKNSYDLKDIYVLSSDLPRTIQTAQSVLSGFYTPRQILTNDNETIEDYFTNDNQVEIGLPWKSVPIHTIPVEHDNIVRQKPSICPKYQQMYWDLSKESDAVHTIFQENNDVSEYFYNQTGGYAKAVKDVWQIMDTLLLEQYYNMTLPSWTEPVFATEKATNFFLFFYEYITFTDEMKRLRVGPLLERLVENMVLNETALSEFDRARSGRKKLYLFSGHDETMAGFMNTLGIFNKKRPPFTSAIMIELHRQPGSLTLQQQKLHIEIYYQNETNREPYQLVIPNCGLECPLEEFMKIVEPYIPLNWDQECQALNEPKVLSTGWIIFIVVVVWIALFVLFQLWLRSTCVSLANKKKLQSTYTNI